MMRFIGLLLGIVLFTTPAAANQIIYIADATDTTAPTVSGDPTIGTDGTTLTIPMSETVTRSGGTFDVDCTTAGNGITATYSSGSGSASLVYTLGTTVNSGDTCNLDYDGAANGIEDGAGNDLAAITDDVITNNSTQGSAVYVYDDFTGTDLTAYYDVAASTACTGTTCDGFELDTANDDLRYNIAGAIVYYTSLNTSDQIVAVKFKNFARYAGVGLRQTGSTDGSTYNGYAFRFESVETNSNSSYGDGLVVRICVDESCDTISDSAWSMGDTLAANHWGVFAVENTGSSTVFSFWDRGTDNPDTDLDEQLEASEITALGAADHTWTDAGTGDEGVDLTNVVNSGNYVFVYNGSSYDCDLDVLMAAPK